MPITETLLSLPGPGQTLKQQVSPFMQVLQLLQHMALLPAPLQVQPAGAVPVATQHVQQRWRAAQAPCASQHSMLLPSVQPAHCTEVFCASLQSEALCIHNCQLDAVQHLLLAAVLRQQQCVEAGVAGGQLVAVRAVTLDHTLQRTQAANGSPATQQRK